MTILTYNFFVLYKASLLYATFKILKFVIYLCSVFAKTTNKVANN